jgi:hypothetical protein
MDLLLYKEAEMRRHLAGLALALSIFTFGSGPASAGGWCWDCDYGRSYYYGAYYYGAPAYYGYGGGYGAPMGAPVITTPGTTTVVPGPAYTGYLPKK